MTQGLRTRAYWAAHIARNAPTLAYRAVPLAIASRTVSPPSRRQMMVATHHKVLTVFLSRVFRVFAAITARSYDLNSGKRLDYSSDVQIDHKSTPQWDRLPDDLFGLHVIRDPRDIIVSSAFYHTKSAEKWLHRPNAKYDGLTYQQKINSFEMLEDRLLFEIEESSGVIIRDMLAWDYSREGIVELRYDQLVGEGAAKTFSEAIAGWPIKPGEKALLTSLFRYFSLGGPGTKKSKHIRNPKSGQWQEHFTPRVEAAFSAAFPGAIEQLGYDQQDAASSAPKEVDQ